MDEFKSEKTLSDRPANTCEFGDDLVDINKLIDLAADLPGENVSVDYFIDKLGEDSYWFDSDGEWIKLKDITEKIKNGKSLDQILQENPKWEVHINKIKNADYESYPIILIGNIIIDGMHRLVKAFVDGKSDVLVKRFNEVPQDVIINKK